jgi:hypothetical protein
MLWRIFVYPPYENNITETRSGKAPNLAMNMYGLCFHQTGWRKASSFASWDGIYQKKSAEQLDTFSCCGNLGMSRVYPSAILTYAKKWETYLGQLQ